METPDRGKREELGGTERGRGPGGGEGQEEEELEKEGKEPLEKVPEQGCGRGQGDWERSWLKLVPVTVGPVTLLAQAWGM